MWRVCVVTRGVVVGMVEACGVVFVELGVQIDMACWFLPKCRSGEVSGGALRRAWPRVRDGQRKGGERKERRGQGHTDDVRGVKRGKGVNSTGHRIGWKTAEES